MSVRDSKVELTSFPLLNPSLSKLYQYLNYLVWAGGNLNVPGTLPCPRTGVPGPVLCLERWTSSPLQVPNLRGLVWTAGTVPPVLPIPAKIKVNPNQLSEQMDHPVPSVKTKVDFRPPAEPDLRPS